MNSVLIGLFDTQTDAAQARSHLVNAGFAANAVTLIGDSVAATSASGVGVSDASEHKGAVARFFDGLFGNGHDDDSAHAGYADTYHEAFRRGAYGVSVTTLTDAELDKAERLLNEAGAVDIDEKAASWRKDGWTDGRGGVTEQHGTADTVEAGETRKLQELEEELKVGKRAVARGGVRIFTRLTEVPVSETVRLREEHARVKRTAIDRPATEADFAAVKEGSFEVREMGEEAVVSKSARVVGEVEICKTTTEREETVRDTLRSTKVEVEQLEGESADTIGSKTTATGRYAGGSENRDPITGAPGAHPIGTGLGAAAGGVAAGAAAGSVAGPIGTVVGAAAGAIAGGLAGKGVAEKVDPTITKSRTPY